MHPVYTLEECKEQNIDYIYWKDAVKGDMALSDDGYVGECLDRKEYDNGKKLFIKCIYGCQFVRDGVSLLFLPNHELGIYSLLKPRPWAEREANQKRTLNVVNAYIGQLMSPYKVDWMMLGNIYRSDQKRPDIAVKRLFKNTVVKKMIEEKLMEVMTEKGITRAFVLDKMLKAVEIAEDKKDSNGILKATDSFMDLLQMKQGKRTVTDTMQIDLTSQISDQIETEEKKLLMSRKTEADDDEL
jgi:hypothetical protein